MLARRIRKVREQLYESRSERCSLYWCSIYSLGSAVALAVSPSLLRKLS
jgi:hypothetical protein